MAIVFARSYALMPVVMPSVASTETAKAVRWDSRFSGTIWEMPRRRSWCSTVGTQINPRAWRIIMLTASGVTLEAAITKSPSFSRFSSSVTITSLPAAMSARASSMLSNGSSMERWKAEVGESSRGRKRGDGFPARARYFLGFSRGLGRAPFFSAQVGLGSGLAVQRRKLRSVAVAPSMWKLGLARISFA